MAHFEVIAFTNVSVQAAALQGDDSTPSAFYSFGVKAKNVS